MSKFAKPAAKPAPTAAEIDRIIDRADAEDGRPPESQEVRFTMTLPPDMAAEVDKARRSLGLTRLAWIRLAIREKLKRED